MDLAMAGGVEQLAVLGLVAAAEAAPDPVVVLPPRDPRDRLAAVRAEPVLPLPQVQQRPSPLQGGRHRHAQAALEVRLPGRVVRVGVLPNGDMPFDRRQRCRDQADIPR